MGEFGFSDLSGVMRLGADRNSAKSFVNMRGLSRMRHLEILGLWFQKEIQENKFYVEKIPSSRNAADFMTKILGSRIYVNDWRS